jgi:FMN reductase
MATFLSISASPQAISSTHAVLSHVNRRLVAAGHTVRTLPVRELPPGPLLAADSSDPEIAEAIEAVAGADALVVATPVYQAAYSGLLKVFLDVLPQFAFRGKSVLPIVTGGSPAHVLAVDYALRPILSAWAPRTSGRAGSFPPRTSGFSPMAGW